MTVELNEQRTKVFLDRYALKDAKGEPTEDHPMHMWARVSDAIGNDDNEIKDFYGILEDFKFVPGGRILAGAGSGTEQTFYNCYVIPVEPKPSTRKWHEERANGQPGNDSREAIFDTVATMVDIMSRGGGVGINWSVLRPSGSYLSRVSGTSSGPVGWMDVASKAVGEVEQGGSRRGAAMFMLDDWHPDILKFVEAKRDLSRITNANVSVAISDSFMEAVKAGANWDLRFPDTTDPHYNSEWDGNLAEWERNGYSIRVHRTVPAREIWRAIVESAHVSGEPGIVFLDRYNKQSTGAGIEQIISVNPCGEQGLGAYSVCNLGSLNLAAYVVEDMEHGGIKETYKFDWDEFRRDIPTAVRFLDNVIDKSYYWDSRSLDQQKKLRRIGLGVMGLADALILLGLRYGSKEAVEFTEKVFKAMKYGAITKSIILAEEKGPAGAYAPDVWERPYLQEYGGEGFSAPLRNLFFLTQAPTGTTSILAGVNSGIEPLFALSYTRKDRTGEHIVVAPVLDRLPDEPDEAWPDYVTMSTAGEVSVEDHIAMQAAVQKYVDSSVSKTINAPNESTVEDVDKAYMLMYDSGLKGGTYFRDGCGRDQVLSIENPKPTSEEVELRKKIEELEEQAFVGVSDYRRPIGLSGTTTRLNTSMGTLYLTINKDDSGIAREVFVNVGKAGSDVMALGEAIGRLVSLGLQSGLSLGKLASQLVGVGGTSVFNPGLVHAIGKALEDETSAYLADPFSSLPLPESGPKPIGAMVTQKKASLNDVCPECGNYSLVREEGCKKCHNCGYSAC